MLSGKSGKKAVAAYVILGALAAVMSQVLAAPPRQIVVLASALQRSPLASGSKEALLPLPNSIGIDAKGRQFRADLKGRMDLRQASGDVKIYLDSPYFKVTKEGAPAYFKTVPASAVAEGGQVVFDESSAPLVARMCRAHLERARAEVLAALPFGDVPQWFESQVECAVDYDEGCNSGWDGKMLMFHKGNASCEPAADVSDLIYHEYGHGVFDHLTRGRFLDQRVNEAVADLIAAFITEDPRFGYGFNKERQLSWIRDLSLAKVFPQDYRGTYTGAETFSSAWWELRQAINAEVGRRRGAKLSMRVLLSSLRLMKRAPNVDNLSAAAVAGVTALLADGEASAIPGISCTARRIFSSHGLVAAPTDCGAISLSSAAAASAAPAADVTITNEGLAALTGLFVRAGKTLIPVAHLPAGGKTTVRVPIANALKQEAPECGERVSQLVYVFSSTSELLGKIEASAHAGQIGEEREISVNALGSASSVAIPDAPAEDQAGAWVRLPFHFDLGRDEKVVSASLELVTNHPYSSDLLVGFIDSKERIHEVYKGEEEIPLPARISAPGAEDLSGGHGEVVIRDVAKSLEGSLSTARVHLKVARFGCR